jgi:hypothetical protein
MSATKIRWAALIPLLVVMLTISACDQGKVDAPLTDTKGNPVTRLTAATFANPPLSNWPWVRWNFTPETAEIAELERELEDLYNAGVGGVEIGQGGTPTFEQPVAILKKATGLGIKVSIKYKDGAPVPGTFAADHDYVRKMVHVTDVLVPAGDTYTGTLAGEGTIAAVLAYQSVGSPEEEIEGEDTQIIELVRTSVIDLTSTLTGTNSDGFFEGTTTGNIQWTAPAQPSDATWVLIAIRAISYSLQPEVYSREGTDLPCSP